ncbi:MAG: sulfatase [Acidobacteria bacterium]|nr:sulfatase [Acidobacteriota bacterium]
MRRSTILITVLVTCVLLVAALLLLRPPGRRAAEDASSSPLHYFIADNLFGDEVLRCDLSWKADRAATPEAWDQPLQPCSLGTGWTRPMRDGARAWGPGSDLTFFLERTDWAQLIVTARAVPLTDFEYKRAMQVSVNGRSLGVVEISSEWTTIAIEIPPDTLEAGPNRFSFSFPGHGPQEATATMKRRARPVAASISEVALARSLGADGSPAGPRSFLDTSSDEIPPPTQVFDRKSGQLVIRRSGTLVLPVELEDDAQSLMIEVGLPWGLDRRRSRLALRLENLSSGAVQTLRLPFDEKASVFAWGRLRWEIPLDGFAGDPCLITFEADPQPEGAAIEITPPRRLTPKELERSSRAPPAVPPAETPDIVLITLDAARTDHFSCYGYPRPTTPSIDRLAARSLVFTNAFALAPYTLCSVPTMITGLSFLNHSVLTREHVLGHEATTLAELLKSEGYRTVCFSCSPNNSRAMGSAQGYDEFYELWTEVPRDESRVPTYLSGRVVEWLQENESSQPLHLQLHFIPPHTPYTPAPEFDVFTDPSYDGPCDGDHLTIAALDTGRLRPTPEDLQHVIALYDGNLLAADSAVQEVLLALQARPRWKNTVVLITADHGDAFLEHGRTGHNSTVYDEMLRVPFILRMPEEFDGEGIDVDRLVTLADIVPTLLATIPARVNTPLDGVDLTEVPEPGRKEPGRLFVARAISNFPLLALRTERWKVVLTDWGHGELYDLHRDPEEQHDISLENRPVFVGMSQLLARRLGAPPLLEPTSKATDVSDADREMLEALGYTE